jgi:GH43 family beta-xylosidase
VVGKIASLWNIFHSDSTCFEINPATWLCLAQHGVAIRGPRPPVPKAA